MGVSSGSGDGSCSIADGLRVEGRTGVTETGATPWVSTASGRKDESSGSVPCRVKLAWSSTAGLLSVNVGLRNKDLLSLPMLLLQEERVVGCIVLP